MRRWSIRILVGLLLLIAVVVVVVQLVLWSSLPKKIVAAQIEKELGLRISADTLSTNWFGHSTLTNVSLGLPLSHESFLHVRTLQIKHNSLIGLAVGNAIAVDRIEVDQPVVQMRQDAQGNINVLEVLQTLARVLGSNSAKQSAESTGVPKLPRVKLVDATVHFTDKQGRTADLQHIQLDGYPADALVWKYDLKVGDSIALDGEVAPGGAWKHQVDLTAKNLQPLVAGYGLSTYDAVVKAHWAGQLDGDAVNGQLTLDQVTAKHLPVANDFSAKGVINVNVADGVVTIKPQRLDLTTGNAMLNAIEVANGSLVYGGGGAHLNSIQLGALGGLAVVDGQFNPATFAGDLRARWNGFALPGGLTHGGRFEASLKTPFVNHPVINVDLESHGRQGDDRWDAKLNVAGIGESWKNIDWVLTAPQLQATDGVRKIELAELVGHVSQRLPVIRLKDLSLPARPHLQSFGVFDAQTGVWSAYLNAGGTTSAEQTPVPIDFTVDARGTKDRITLNSLSVQVAQVAARANGYYALDTPNPVHLELVVDRSSPLAAAGAPPAVQGSGRGDFHVTGYFFKQPDGAFDPSIDVSGELTSSDLIVLQKPVGDIDLRLAGGYHNKRGHLETTELRLFKGRWNFNADYPTARHGFKAELDVDDLPLDELAKFADVQGVNGQLTHAEWKVDAESADLAKLQVKSRYALRDLSLDSVPGVVINRVTADASVADGVVSVRPIDIACGTGTIDGSLSMDLQTHDHVAAEFHVHQLPYSSGDTTVSTSADTKLDIALKPLGVTGLLTAATDVNYGSVTLAHAVLDSSAKGRTLSIKNLGGNVLGGTFQGNFVIDADQPLEANGQLRWYNLDSSALVAVAPGLKGLGGKYSGTVTVAPARDPRPIAPVRIDINVAADDGHFKTVRIGQKGLFAIHAVAYADTDPSLRFILDHSDIHVANGLAHLWARIDRGQNVILDLEHLDLDEVAHVVDNLQGPYPGVLDGRFSVVGNGIDPNNLIGNGKIVLTHSDLANFGPLALLYSVANAGGSPTPIGYGTIGMSFEQKTLKVTDFHYFNRGIDAEGLFRVGPLVLPAAHTPVIGTVTGTAQVLKSSRLQLLSDVNDIFASAQGALASVGVDGSVGKPHIFAAAASALGSSVQEIVGGDTHSETGDATSGK